MRLFAALVMTCVVSGACTTEAQHYAAAVGQRAQATLGQYKTCERVLDAKPEFTRVYQKLAVSTADDPFREPTAAQLSDSEVISDEDKTLYLAWFSEGQACATPAIEGLGRLAPEIEVYFANVQADQADILNEFIINRHTFGEANSAISALKARMKARAKEMGSDMKARFEAWDREEKEQTVENVAFVVGFVAVAVATRGQVSIAHLATRQSALARSQAYFLRVHPAAALTHRVRVIRCNGIGRTLRCALNDYVDNNPVGVGIPADE